MLAPFRGKGAGEINDTTLGGMVRRSRGDLVAYESIHRGYIDYTAVFRGNHSLGGDSPRDLERTEQIDLELVFELGVSDLLGGSHSSSASVIDKNINPAETLQSLGDDILDLLSRSDVATQRKNLNTKISPDATSSNFSSLLAIGTTLHPALARALAICTPNPLEQPVTRATCPFISK